jgi:flagellar basal body-associated protein FliL
MNGFDTAGWAKKKSKESTLEEKTKQEPASTWGRKLKLMTMIAVGLVILMGAVVGLSKHLGSKEVAERAVHIQEAVQEAVQKLVQTETVQEVVASASTSTFANSTIVTNSVQKAVQEVVKKETLQEVVASASTTFTNLTDITEL